MFLHVFILLLVAAFVHKTANFAIGLCHRHALTRRRHLTIAWLFSVAGFAITIGAAATYYDSAVPLLIGIVSFLIGLAYGALFATLCSAKRINKYAAWVSGAGQRFVADLPHYPG
jgi:hypothetical protein